MAKKSEPEVVPTGEYKIKMPEVVEISGQASVVPITKEKKPPKPTLLDIFMKRIMPVLLVLLAGFCLVFIAVYRGLIRLPPPGEVIRPFIPPPSPTPVCCNPVRYVTSPKTYLYARPQEGCECDFDVPLWVVREGDPLEEMADSHQFPDGAIWVKVRYYVVAANHVEPREGWVNQLDITTQ